MGRTGITYHDVSNAIAAIQGRQKNPTVDTVREELGTGSKSTINKLLREWKSKNGIANTNEEGIPNELLQLIRGLWQKVQSDADQKIDSHQIEATAEINDSKNRLAQCQQQNALLDADKEDFSKKLTAQIEITEQLKNTLHQEQTEKSQLLERITALEEHNSDHKRENDRLHQLLKKTQDNLVHYQQAVEKQRQDQQLQLEKERREFESKLTLLQHQLNQTNEEKAKAQQSLTHLIQDHQKQTAQLDIAEKSRVEIQTQHQQLFIENKQFNQTIFNNEKLISSLSESLKEQTQARTDLGIQTGILKNENSLLIQNHQDITIKVNHLESNLQKITQENITLKTRLEIRETA